jgi:hypothetical protein
MDSQPESAQAPGGRHRERGAIVADKTATTTGGVSQAFNLTLPMKTPDDLPALAGLIPVVFSDAVRSADTIGTLHNARFVAIDDMTLAFFTVYDGDFETYVNDFTKYLGVVFDAIFEHVAGAPPTPVQKNTESFLAWVAAHNLPVVHGFYSAYPDLSVQDIKMLEATA